MVGPKRPQCVAAPHSVQAREHVLDGPVERVAHVERPGDVGRRDGDREVLVRAALGRGVEVAAVQPALEDAPLGLRGVVSSRFLERLPVTLVHAASVITGYFPAFTLIPLGVGTKEGR